MSNESSDSESQSEIELANVPKPIFGKHRKLLHKSSDTAHAIASALGLTLLPIESWWFIITSIELGLLGSLALPITVGVFVFSAGLFFYEMTTHHDELSKTKENLRDFFETSDDSFKKNNDDIKRKFDKVIQKMEESGLTEKAIANELEKIAIKSGPAFKLKNEYDFNKQMDQSIDKEQLRKKLSAKQATTAGATVFFTICLSTIATVSIFQTLEYLSITLLLGSTFGIALAVGLLAIALGVGIAIAFKHYDEQKVTQKIELEQNKMTNILSEQSKLIRKLDKKLSHHKAVKHADENAEKKIIHHLSLKEAYPGLAFNSKRAGSESVAANPRVTNIDEDVSDQETKKNRRHSSHR